MPLQCRPKRPHRAWNSITFAASKPAQTSKRDGLIQRSLPYLFRQPELGTPASLFPATQLPGEPVARFIRQAADGTRHCLVFTDGCCLANGQPTARGGWAFVHGTLADSTPLTISGRLESQGPTDCVLPATCNRAELRAAIAALRYRDWSVLNISSIVIAADSQLVVTGATEWSRAWLASGWCASKGQPVQNVDLWRALLTRVAGLKTRGVRVGFWKVGRAENAVADRAAKMAALEQDVAKYRDVVENCDGGVV